MFIICSSRCKSNVNISWLRQKWTAQCKTQYPQFLQTVTTPTVLYSNFKFVFRTLNRTYTKSNVLKPTLKIDKDFEKFFKACKKSEKQQRNQREVSRKNQKESGETNNRLLTVQTWTSSERAGAIDCDSVKMETL